MSDTGFIDSTDFVLLGENIKDKPIGVCIEASDQRLLKQYAVKDALSLAFSIIKFCVLAASRYNPSEEG